MKELRSTSSATVTLSRTLVFTKEISLGRRDAATHSCPKVPKYSLARLVKTSKSKSPTTETSSSEPLSRFNMLDFAFSCVTPSTSLGVSCRNRTSGESVIRDWKRWEVEECRFLHSLSYSISTLFIVRVKARGSKSGFVISKCKSWSAFSIPFASPSPVVNEDLSATASTPTEASVWMFQRVQNLEITSGECPPQPPCSQEATPT
mmetsp:Transcript_4981/g.9905  ORF Transcript_4981/g.9905 Transcript_4981/m.9905 type:complete len:205 (-) Transcript_4981:1234-1848(-)